MKRFVLESGRENIVHRLPDDARAVSVQLSPEGKNLAWAEWTRTKEALRWSLMMTSVKGGAIRELLKLDNPAYLSAAFSIAWTPDGQHILVSKFTGTETHSEILRLSLNGEEPQSLGVGMDRIHFGDIHKDGRLVAFYSGQQKGRAREIWALGGFLPEE
jgi:hypothetical protein